MEDTTPTETSSDATAESTSAAPKPQPQPHHKINIRQVKQKTLALLTEVYRTETGDVKRMAMSLLQTLYTIEDHQVAEMNGKIQKLMMLIEQQKREQAEFELEEASLAGSHDGSLSIGTGMEGGTRSRSLTEESNMMSQKVVIGSSASISAAEETSENKDESSSSTESQQSADKLQENNLVKRWQEKLGNFRKAEPQKDHDNDNDDDNDDEHVATTNNVQKQNNWRGKIGNFRKAEPQKDEDNDDDDVDEVVANNNNDDDVQQNNWRESMSTKMDASRERVAKGWRESTTKLQQGWKEQQEKRSNNKMAMMMTVDASKTEDTADGGSVSTEGSSHPNSPVGSEANPSSASKDGDDLLHVIRNFVKDGVDSKKSRESLELALNLRRDRAQSRWAETRAKWKWPTRPATSAFQAQEAS